MVPSHLAVGLVLPGGLGGVVVQVGLVRVLPKRARVDGAAPEGRPAGLGLLDAPVAPHALQHAIAVAWLRHHQVPRLLPGGGGPGQVGRRTRALT